MSNNERRPVLIGESRPSEYSPVMTLRQAQRYAERTLEPDLRRAGFKASVFVSNADLNGGLWFRVCHGMTV